MLKEILIKSLLIMMLPGIIIGLYLEGKRYDPALLDFKSLPKIQTYESEPASKGSLSSKDFSTVSGYNLIGRQRDYTRDNLYEHVNGHAEYFIGMGFKRLTVYEYAKSGNQPEIQVEVFDMSTPLQAFGVLMDAVGSRAVLVGVGSMGYQTQSSILFIKGQYYIRVIPYKKEIDSLAFAMQYEKLLPSSRQDTFDVFSKIPKIGKIVSTRYIKEGYRGLDFLNNVIERQYEVEGGQIHLAFLITKGDESKAIVKSALEFFKKSGAEYQRLETKKGEVFKIHDKYEGDWVLIHSNNTVICLFGDINDEIIRKVSGV